MNARRLMHWGNLEEARRRAAQRGLGALPPWLFSAGAGVLLSAELARGMHVFGESIAMRATPASASSIWLMAVVASHVVVFFGAPFRMYWRRDSAFLARSAIRGGALFRVALWRSIRATMRVAAPCAAAACVLALGPYGDAMLAVRHLLVLGVAALCTGLLAPSVALAAGAIVASDKAQMLLRNMGGEFQAPRTSWLGVLPGLAATAMVVVLLAVAEWSRGGTSATFGDPRLLLAAGAVVPVLAVFVALARAERVMLDATREVAALDQERLAHIERIGPSPLERALGRALGDRGARLVADKDASLARRRYPIPFFLGFVGLVSQWILAAIAAPSMLLWGAIISAGLGVYGVVMARRALTAPIEYPEFLRTLAIAGPEVRRAKRARLGLWIAVYMVLGAIPIAIRSDSPLTAALVLGAICLASAVGGAAASSQL